jgi:hypothetical protein
MGENTRCTYCLGKPTACPVGGQKFYFAEVLKDYALRDVTSEMRLPSRKNPGRGLSILLTVRIVQQRDEFAAENALHAHKSALPGAGKFAPASSMTNTQSLGSGGLKFLVPELS